MFGTGPQDLVAQFSSPPGQIWSNPPYLHSRQCTQIDPLLFAQVSSGMRIEIWTKLAWCCQERLCKSLEIRDKTKRGTLFNDTQWNVVFIFFQESNYSNLRCTSSWHSENTKSGVLSKTLHNMDLKTGLSAMHEIFHQQIQQTSCKYWKLSQRNTTGISVLVYAGYYM